MAILNTSLTTTATPISANLTADTAITVMFFCNLNTPNPADAAEGRQFLDIFVVQSGGIPTTTNKIGNQIPVDASDTYVLNTERLVLSPGDRIYASTTDAGQVSVSISYVII
jgi:hypothetical protein